MRAKGLAVSTAAVGAPSFWAVGLMGGGGPADATPADLAILSDKIEEGHPAFGGVAFQRPQGAGVNTVCGQNVAGCEHGTAVASMAVSRGAVDCGLCTDADATSRGVAPGLDSVLDAESGNPSVNDASWALGVGSFGVSGAKDAAEAMSDSHGFAAATDDDASLQGTDKFIAAYGASMAYPAGNEGPGRTVNEECIAYDTLCMGGFAPNATVDPSDDTIPDFSSRGPSPGGRKKPDLVAVASSEFANQHYLRDGNLWSGGSGTSLAAPQGGAAAALLAGAGISEPIAQKAILIDSARQGRVTPASAMGTQTGWQPDWGWGALNLEQSLAELSHIYANDVPGGEAQFYRTTLVAPGDRATLVWNRRAVGCINPGCGTTALTLTNLDLQQLNPATGVVEAQSASTIDNVEQVRSPRAGDAIYKVKAASTVDGLPGERYAMAATRQITPLTTPRPATELTVDTTKALPGQDVHVQACVTNPSRDLTAENAQVTLHLPAGVSLAPGSAPATQTLGTLPAAGTPGAAVAVGWMVHAEGDDLNRLVADSTATHYGESFSSSDSTAFLSDGTPPTVSLTAPEGDVASPDLPIRWDATDAGSGVRDYDLDAAVDGGPFTSWLSHASATAAVFSGSRGHRYRFRVRATDLLGSSSGYVTSDEVSILQLSAPPPGKIDDPQAPRMKRLDPRIRIRRLKRRGRVLRLAGSLASRNPATLLVTLKGNSAWHRVRLRARVYPQRGRFGAALILPRGVATLAHATITIRFSGDADFYGQTMRRRVRGL